MAATGVNTAQAAAESLIDWWAIAGVTHATRESPVNWLAISSAMQPSSRHLGSPDIASLALASAQGALPEALPDTLDAFQEWLARDATIPEAGWPQLGAHAQRILPDGQAAPALMVIADFPDADDLASGQLLSGEAGRLFDAMLAAIGQSRDSIYLAALAVARPAGGILSESDSARLAQRMRHHIALVGPQHVMLMGDKTSRALLPTGDSGNVIGLRPLNLKESSVDAIGIAHPRFLLKQPSAKAQCWRTMQILLEAKLS